MTRGAILPGSPVVAPLVIDWRGLPAEFFTAACLIKPRAPGGEPIGPPLDFSHSARQRASAGIAI